MMLSTYIEKNKITLIHGESGSGKSIFAVKELNEAGIKPVYIDFDDNELNEFRTLNCECDLIEGETFFDDFIGKNYYNLELWNHLKDKVVIIDTWTLFSAYCGSELNAHRIVKDLIRLGSTVIILAHTTPYSGKEDKPEMEDKIYRHIKARLYIRRTTLKSKIEYHLIIEKLRGHQGDKMMLLRTSDGLDDMLNK